MKKHWMEKLLITLVFIILLLMLAAVITAGAWM